MTLAERPPDRRYDYEARWEGKTFSGTVVSLEEKSFVCSSALPNKCVENSPTIPTFETRGADLALTLAFRLRDIAAKSTDSLQVTGVANQEVNGVSADCFDVVPGPGRSAPTGRLCFSGDSTLLLADVKDGGDQGRLTLDGTPGAVEDADLALPFPLVNVKYKPPTVLSPVPEGVIVVEGPSDQSSIFLLQGATSRAISEGIGYSVIPYHNLIAARDGIGPQFHKTIVLDLAGKHVLEVEGSLLWSPKADNFLRAQTDGQLHGITLDGDELWYTSVPPSASFSKWLPNSSVALFFDRGSHTRAPTLYFVDAQTGETSESPLPEGAYSNPPGFSPDGRYMSYFSGDNFWTHHLWVMDRQNGEICSVNQHAPGHMYPLGATWSPSADILEYWGSNDWALGTGEIHVFNARDCTDQTVSGPKARGAAWAPDGSYLAINDEQSGGTRFWPNSDSAPTTMRSLDRWLGWSPQGHQLAAVGIDSIALTNLDTR